MAVALQTLTDDIYIFNHKRDYFDGISFLYIILWGLIHDASVLVQKIRPLFIGVYMHDLNSVC